MITTILLPVSRPDFLPRIFAQLDMMYCDRDQTNILCYVDGDQKLYEKARNLTVNSKFNERLCVYRSKGPANVGSITRRRQRIADIHNELRTKIGVCDFIFLLEDDTLIPLDTIEKMLVSYSSYPHAGFITGLQVGRWGYEHLGAWHVDDPYLPKQITSSMRTEGFHTIDAAGFYCCMMRRDTYLGHHFEPFDDVLGPDVQFGFSLRKDGYQNYVDASIHTKHLTKRGEISVATSKIIQVNFDKVDERWIQKVLE